MIWALLALWFFSGGGSDGHIRPFSMPIEQALTLVQQQVTDPARRAQAEKVLKQMADIETARSKALSAYQEELQKIVDDRTAPKEPFSALTDAERTKASAFQEQMIALRFQLKQHLTAAEWALVFPVPPTSP